MIIEHRLEDVLWRDVDRIVLMGDGKILADLHPDELLSTRLLEENGIRELFILLHCVMQVWNLLLRRNRHMLILL